MKKINKYALITIFIVLTAPFATASDTSETDETTPSDIRLSGLEQFIDAFTAEHIGVKTAGAVAAIVKDGELIFNKAYGYAVQDEAAAGTDSIFEWGSATKLLVWTSVMQLAEQGKIGLNTDIREYLPANFLKKLKYETPITMYNLMHHNAGWEDRIVDLFYADPKTVPCLEGAILAYEPAQVFRPGTTVAYSNFGTALAGFIVQRVSGMLFHEYVWKNIFEPAGMTETALHPLQADNPSVGEKRGQIKGHIPGRGKPVVSPMERIYIGMYPAGSAMGTAQDAVKFLAALMPAEGETSVLFNDNKTLDEMLSVSLSFREGFPRFSHGFMEYYGAVRALGHGGNTTGFSSLFTIAPEDRFAVVVMANQANESAMCGGLTKALFGEFTPQGYPGEFPDARKFASSFTMARKPFYGFSNQFMSLTVLPVKAVDENTLDLAGAKLIQISPYVFKNSGGGLELLDIIEYIFIETENDTAVTRASIVYFDFLPAKTGKMIIDFGGAILLVLCLLYVFAAIIISIIGAVRNKKKNIPSNIMKKLNVILYTVMAAAIANNVILAARALSFSVYASLKAHFVFNIVYMIFVPVCIGFMIANRKKEPAKTSKVFNTFTMAASLILAVLVLAWELWF